MFASFLLDRHISSLFFLSHFRKLNSVRLLWQVPDSPRLFRWSRRRERHMWIDCVGVVGHVINLLPMSVWIWISFISWLPIFFSFLRIKKELKRKSVPTPTMVIRSTTSMRIRQKKVTCHFENQIFYFSFLFFSSIMWKSLIFCWRLSSFLRV